MERNSISVRWAKSWQTPLLSAKASSPDEWTPVVPGTYRSSLCTHLAVARTASWGSCAFARLLAVRSMRLLNGV